MTDTPTPTQADREAAASMWRTLIGAAAPEDWQADWMIDGAGDYGPVVQAFARHRVDTLEVAIEEAPSITAPISSAEPASPHDYVDGWLDGADFARRKFLAALEALKGGE